MQKGLKKKIWTHKGLRTKNDELMKAHALKKRRKIAMF